MKYRFFTKIFIIISLVFITISATLNYIVNPYSIFNHQIFSSFFKVKQNTVSSRMTTFYAVLHKNPKNIVMGSSRAGLLPLGSIKKYLSNDIYSLAMQGSNIEEQTQYLKYMINTQNLKTIIWSLDFYSFNPDLKNDSSFSYERVNNSSFIKNDYKIALFSFQSTKNSLKTIIDNLQLKKEVQKNTKHEKPISYLDTINNLSKEEIDTRTNIQLHYYPNKFLHSKNFKNPNSIDKNLKKFKYIVNLCSKKHIKLYIYTSPVSKSFLNLYSNLKLDKTFIYWKEKLVSIHSYTDFCTSNTITNNPYNFMDGSHIKPMFSKQIFAKIFHDKTIDVPSGFSIYEENK